MPEIFTNSRISSKAVQKLSDWHTETVQQLTGEYGEGTPYYKISIKNLDESLHLGDFVFRDMAYLGRRYRLPKTVQIQIIRHMREYKYINHPQQKGNQERTMLLHKQLGLCRKEANKDFQALCMDKVVKFITSTGRAMLMSGACSMVEGKPVGSDWTKAWDSDGWNGNIKLTPQGSHQESESPISSQQIMNSNSEPPTPCDETEGTPSQISAKDYSPMRARDSSPPDDNASSAGQIQVIPRERPHNYSEEFSEYLNWEPSEEPPPAKRACFSSPAPLPPTPLPEISSAPPSQPPARPFAIPRHLEGLRIVTLQAHFAPSFNLTIDPRRLHV